MLLIDCYSIAYISSVEYTTNTCTTMLLSTAYSMFILYLYYTTLYYLVVLLVVFSVVVTSFVSFTSHLLVLLLVTLPLSSSGECICESVLVNGDIGLNGVVASIFGPFNDDVYDFSSL